MKRPAASKNKQTSVPQTKSFVARNKLLLVWASIILAVLLLAGIYKYVTYIHKFSDKDFMAIEQAAENVFRKVGATDIQKYEDCSYEAPEKYSSVRLYCGIEMAVYLPYRSSDQATGIARLLETETEKLGTVVADLSEFYENPSDAYTWTTVNLQKPLSDAQCSFTIATGERGGKVANHLPYRTDGNLIGIAFDCSAESREEYFPVTYR